MDESYRPNRRKKYAGEIPPNRPYISLENEISEEEYERLNAKNLEDDRRRDEAKGIYTSKPEWKDKGYTDYIDEKPIEVRKEHERLKTIGGLQQSGIPAQVKLMMAGEKFTSYEDETKQYWKIAGIPKHARLKPHVEKKHTEKKESVTDLLKVLIGKIDQLIQRQ